MASKKTPKPPLALPEPLPEPCPAEARAFLSVDRAPAKRIEGGVVPTFIVDMPAFMPSKHIAAVVVRTDKGVCAFHVSIGNYTLRGERRALIQIEDCHREQRTYATAKARKPAEAAAWARRDLVAVDTPPAPSPSPSPVEVRQADRRGNDAVNEHAMHQIAELLLLPSNFVGTLDAIETIVRGAGWTVDEPSDVDADDEAVMAERRKDDDE